MLELFFLKTVISAGMFYQAIVEDWAGLTAASATNANPMAITTTVNHGYAGHAYAILFLTGSVPADNATVTIDGTVYRYKTSLSGCSANDILIQTSAEAGSVVLANYNNAAILASAIRGETTGWRYVSPNWTIASLSSYICAGTSAHSTVEGYTDFNGSVYARAKTAGASGHGIAVSDSGTATTWYRGDKTNTATTLQIQWFSRIAGLTGNWAAANGCRLSTYVDADTFSIPVNSTAYGSFSGQSMSIRRTAADASCGNWSPINTDGFPGTVEQLTEGVASHSFPSCSTSDTPERCADSFMVPYNQKGYSDLVNVSTLTVSSGTATAVFAGDWPLTPSSNAYTAMGVDARVFFQGYQKYGPAGVKTVTGAVNNGSGLVRLTVTAHGCTSSPTADLALVANVGGVAAANGTWTPTIINANTIDLQGTTFSGTYTSGGTVTCNPHGRAAQTEAQYMARGNRKAYKVLTWNASTRTATFASTLSDGSYTGTCAPAGTACVIPGHTAPYGAITVHAYSYFQLRPKNRTTGSNYFYPVDQIWWNIKRGTYNPLSNRFRMWVKWGVDYPRPSGYNVNLGTYIMSPAVDNLANAGASSSHFYHQTRINKLADAWMQLEFNGAPTHQVGGPPSAGWPNDPMGFPGHPWSPAYKGGDTPRSYYLGHNFFYLDALPAGPAGYSTQYGRIEMDYAANEPEEWVKSRQSLYGPSRWINGVLTATPGYEFGWNSMAFAPTPTFHVRYSTADSLKTLGFSNGTDGGTVTVDNYLFGGFQSLWQLDSPTQADDMYVGIRPEMGIAGAAPAGQDRWLFFRADPGMEVGDTVTVTGAGGNRDVTNTAITAVAPRKIWFLHKPPDGITFPAWTADADLISIVASGGTCTASLRVNHGTVPGALIEITGSTNTALGQTALAWDASKRFTIATTPTSSTFTFSCPGVTNGTYNTDFAAGPRLNIMLYPGVAVGDTATGSWTGSGTMISTEENKNFAEIHLTPYVTASTPPNAPSNLAAFGVTPTRIDGTFSDNSTDEESFELQRKTGAGGAYATIQTLDANSTAFSDTTVSSSTTYFYRIRATNVAGSSSYSSEAEVTTDSPTPPVPADPTGLTALSVSQSSINLGWSDNATNEDGYAVEQSISGNWVQIALLSAGSQSHLVTGLTASTSYDFRVKATNALAGDSGYATLTQSTSGPMASRLCALGSTYAAFCYTAPNTSTCTASVYDSNSQLVGEVTDAGGVRNRMLTISGLAPAESYTDQITCPTSGAGGSFTTRAAPSGTVSLTIAAQHIGQSVDNFVVDYGFASLDNQATAACSSGTCAVTISVAAGSTINIQRRHCRNRASDATCSTPSNEVSRSVPETLSVN